MIFYCKNVEFIWETEIKFISSNEIYKKNYYFRENRWQCVCTHILRWIGSLSSADTFFYSSSLPHSPECQSINIKFTRFCFSYYFLLVMYWKQARHFFSPLILRSWIIFMGNVRRLRRVSSELQEEELFFYLTLFFWKACAFITQTLSVEKCQIFSMNHRWGHWEKSVCGILNDCWVIYENQNYFIIVIREIRRILAFSGKFFSYITKLTSDKFFPSQKELKISHSYRYIKSTELFFSDVKIFFFLANSMNFCFVY